MPRQSPNTIRTRSSLPPLPSKTYLANFVRLCDAWSDWACFCPTRVEIDELLDETEAIKADSVRFHAECDWWEQARTTGVGALPPAGTPAPAPTASRSSCCLSLGPNWSGASIASSISTRFPGSDQGAPPIGPTCVSGGSSGAPSYRAETHERT